MEMNPIDDGLWHLGYLLSELLHIPEVSQAIEDLSLAVLIFLMRWPLGEGLRHMCRFTMANRPLLQRGWLEDQLGDAPFQIPRDR
jgi:hypothetical protein